MKPGTQVLIAVQGYERLGKLHGTVTRVGNDNVTVNFDRVGRKVVPLSEVQGFSYMKQRITLWSYRAVVAAAVIYLLLEKI